MKTANEFWDDFNEKHGLLFCDLFDRWLDEKEYEPISQYETELKKVMPEIQQMTGEPFGFSVICTDGLLTVAAKRRSNYIEIEYLLRANPSQVELTT